MRRLLALVACLAVVASACGSGRATETADGAAIRWIDIDGRTNRFNASFLAFFPEAVTVRPGDVVVFRSTWTGEPHTVTMGTLIDGGLTTGEPAPSALPSWTLGESEFLPPNVGRPCYLDEGAPPEDQRQSCPVVDRPPFTGRQTYYSSGFLPDEAEFRVELSGDIEPATYRFFCSFHGPQMSGELRVVEPGQQIPSQAEVDGAARERMGALVDDTLDVHQETFEPYERTRVGSFPWPALVSFQARDGIVRVNEFVPFTLKARVDEAVRWSLLGAHTITFAAPDSAKPPAIRILGTGETELKADAFNESRSPKPPRGPPESPITLEAGPYERGYLSSGMLYSPERELITYVMEFSSPGSYRYECLLHPRMTGLVTVAA